MDNKVNFMAEIITNLSYRFNQSDVRVITFVLNKVLENYSVEKIETNSLIPVDDYNNELIKRYIIKKDMAGVSKNTLGQYVRETRKFLIAINKKACDITSNDIENYLIAYKYQNKISNTTLNNMKTFINNFFNR